MGFCGGSENAKSILIRTGVTYDLRRSGVMLFAILLLLFVAVVVGTVIVWSFRGKGSSEAVGGVVG